MSCASHRCRRVLQFFQAYTHLLQSDNYVTRRQSLKVRLPSHTPTAVHPWLSCTHHSYSHLPVLCPSAPLAWALLLPLRG